jgi:hypothetical protein
MDLQILPCIAHLIIFGIFIQIIFGEKFQYEASHDKIFFRFLTAYCQPLSDPTQV